MRGRLRRRLGVYAKAASVLLSAGAAGAFALVFGLAMNAASSTPRWPGVALQWIQQHSWQTVGVCTGLGAVLSAAKLAKLWRDALQNEREALRAIRTASGEAAADHPYPLLTGVDLMSVYMPGRTEPVEVEPGKAPLWQNTARDPFSEKGLCLIEGGPGSGKSTLLRHQVLEPGAQRDYLYLINAVAVARGLRRRSLPDVLAQSASHDLADLRDGWQILIDGLDEVASGASRTKILEAAAQVLRDSPRTFRFVITTRHVDEKALAKIQEKKPVPISRYRLTPIDEGDVAAFVAGWLTGLGAKKPDRAVRSLLDHVAKAGIADLIRTPLLASLLCQLYAQNKRTVPKDRSGIYEQYAAAWQDRLTHPRTGLFVQLAPLLAGHAKPTVKAVAKTLDRGLLSAVDALAASRQAGSSEPVLTVIASHMPAPDGVLAPDKWTDILSSALGRVGVLTGHGDDLDFAQPTFREYHAARHAAREEDAVRRYFGEDEKGWIAHEDDEDRSYLAFLLDALPPSRLDKELEQLDEEIKFLLDDEDGDLAGVAIDTLDRLLAHRARCRTWIINRLELIADDDEETPWTRVDAAEVLARHGHATGPQRLLAFAEDTSLDGLYPSYDGQRSEGEERVRAADALARLEKKFARYAPEGIAWLIKLTGEEDAPDRITRAFACLELGFLDGRVDDGLRALLTVIDELLHGQAIDTCGDDHKGAVRTARDAAYNLAVFGPRNGRQPPAVPLLARLVVSPLLDGAKYRDCVDALRDTAADPARRAETLDALCELVGAVPDDDAVLAGAWFLGLEAARILAQELGETALAAQKLHDLMDRQDVHPAWHATAAELVLQSSPGDAKAKTFLAEYTAIPDAPAAAWLRPREEQQRNSKL